MSNSEEKKTAMLAQTKTNVCQFSFFTVVQQAPHQIIHKISLQVLQMSFILQELPFQPASGSAVFCMFCFFHAVIHNALYFPPSDSSLHAPHYAVENSRSLFSYADSFLHYYFCAGNTSSIISSAHPNATVPLQLSSSTARSASVGGGALDTPLVQQWQSCDRKHRLSHSLQPQPGSSIGSHYHLGTGFLFFFFIKVGRGRQTMSQ